VRTGSVLVALLKAYPDLEVVSLVRDPLNAAKVAALSPSMKTIVGDNKSLDVVTAAAADADVVIATQNADDVPLAQVVIKGLEKRAAIGPTTKPVLINTSGTGITEIGKDGRFADGKWYDVSTCSCEAGVITNT
jgi:hypothetical protein